MLEKFQDVVVNYGYDLNEYSACTPEEVTHAKEVAEALADHKRRMRARAEAQVARESALAATAAGVLEARAEARAATPMKAPMKP